ncbi:MAG TPA: serpin family protein [Gemmatimonadales bacterium]|nr:serpin family protein [Gemmatimonadales bacterium]
MKTPLRLPAVLLTLLACACAKDPVGPPPRITALPRALTPGEQQLIQADNRFAIKLLKQATADTRDTLKNLFVSPLSVAMALAMTYNGAAGATEDSMRATLELDGMSVGEVNESYRSLIELLRQLDPHVRFQIANSIWYLQGYTIEQPFLDANHNYYDAQVTALDFSSPTAPATINAWVNQHTQGIIKTIVDVIPDGMRLYLINAIYFKGDWTEQFDPHLTQPRSFRLPDGTTVNVPTMTHGQEADVRVAHGPSATIVDLPYGGAAFSMTIVLPHDTSSADQLVDALTPEQWNEWTASLEATTAEVFLPKFKLTNDLNLIPSLAGLGMGIAFGDGRADFSRIHVPSELSITEVKHKTYVDVNEEGTVAAAVTSVGLGLTSASPYIMIDRPFIFALRENLSGTILFMGVIRHPTIQ